MGYPTSSGESTAALVGLIVCMIVILGFITMTGFLFADLRSAQGANQKIEQRVHQLQKQYEVDCRRDDYK